MSTYWENLSEREKDWNMFSDFYKAVYGIRPRGHEFIEASDERRKELWDQLSAENKIVEEQERQAEQKAIEKFEALILKTMEMGASCRNEAIRWIVDGLRELVRMDSGFICFELGLPYSYKNMFEEVLA